jgi:acyl-coenzyme A thioesterase PaaI-like protein
MATMDLAKEIMTRAEVLPTRLRETLFIRAYALAKIPLLYFARPVIEELDNDHCVVRLKLNRRTKNHVGSMYFGALSIGADLAGGLMANKLARQRGAKLQILFKDFHADFLARAESDVLFTCDDGKAIRDAVDRALAAPDRVNIPIRVTATAPKSRGDDPVARFALTLSLKRK